MSMFVCNNFLNSVTFRAFWHNTGRNCLFGPLILRYTGSQNLSVCMTHNGSMIWRDLRLVQRHIPAENNRRPAVLICLHRK